MIFWYLSVFRERLTVEFSLKLPWATFIVGFVSSDGFRIPEFVWSESTKFDYFGRKNL